MTNILALNPSRDTQHRQPQPERKPGMVWVVDTATGRPVMAWSVPQPARQSAAA